MNQELFVTQRLVFAYQLLKLWGSMVCVLHTKFLSAQNLTDDHVPPKLLFARPYPANLWTVPACRDCNAAFQLDDEYTRTVIVADVRAAKHPDVKAKLPSIERSLQRPNARAFAEYLAKQTTSSRVLGVSGLPMGAIFDVEGDRVNATGAHIIRGLYFVEMKTRVPDWARIKMAAKANVRSSEIHDFVRCYQKLPAPPPTISCRRNRLYVESSENCDSLNR